MGHHNKAGLLYLISFILALFMILVMIAGAACPWYQYEYGGLKVDEYLTYEEGTIGNLNFNCKYTDAKNKRDNNIAERDSYDCEVKSQFKTMYGIITAICIVAIVLLAVAIVILLFFSFQWCARFHWRRHLRIPLIIIVVLVSVLCLAAWVIFFWHPTALTNGDADCDSSGVKDSPLCKFVGDDWGPHAGWALYIVAFVFSVILAVLVIISGPPDGSGYTVFH